MSLAFARTRGRPPSFVNVIPTRGFSSVPARLRLVVIGLLALNLHVVGIQRAPDLVGLDGAQDGLPPFGSSVGAPGGSTEPRTLTTASSPVLVAGGSFADGIRWTVTAIKLTSGRECVIASELLLGLQLPVPGDGDTGPAPGNGRTACEARNRVALTVLHASDHRLFFGAAGPDVLEIRLVLCGSGILRYRPIRPAGYRTAFYAVPTESETPAKRLDVLRQNGTVSTELLFFDLGDPDENPAVVTPEDARSLGDEAVSPCR